METSDLKSIPLRQADIDLITFALRRLSETTGLFNLQVDAKELIGYIEEEAKLSEGK